MRLLFIFICLLWGGLAFAQGKNDKSSQSQESEEDKIEKYRIEGCRMKDDIVSVRLSLYAFSHKLLSPTVMKMPGWDYKDRFLVCENCKISDFKQTKPHYIDTLYISLPRTEKYALLTLNSKEGKRLKEYKILLYPKVNFFLNINETDLLKLDSTTTIPSIRPTDKLRLVATTEDGKNIKIERHLLYNTTTMGNLPDRTWGDELIEEEKNMLLNPNRRAPFYISFIFLDDEGYEWKRHINLIVE